MPIPSACGVVLLNNPRIGHFVICMLIKKHSNANLSVELHTLYLQTLEKLVERLKRDDVNDPDSKLTAKNCVLHLLSSHDGVISDNESSRFESALESLNGYLQSANSVLTADEIYMSLMGKESCELLAAFTESQWKYKRKMFEQQYRASGKPEAVLEEMLLLHILHDHDRKDAWRHIFRLIREKQKHFLDMVVVRAVAIFFACF